MLKCFKKSVYFLYDMIVRPNQITVLVFIDDIRDLSKLCTYLVLRVDLVLWVDLVLRVVLVLHCAQSKSKVKSKS